jgi:RNA polymerase subunit RPABC4/transcription elongation factor Spt4
MENRKPDSENPIDPGHKGPLALFRVLGPVILGLGILLIVIAMVDFFSCFGSMREPRFIWMPFLGIPMLFVGGVLSQFGYAGKVARFMAQEMAPVGKDTFNYLADGTQEGIKTVAAAVGKGLAEGGVALGTKGATKVRCQKCNTLAEDGAKFCPQCGGAMIQDKPCPNCKHLNDTDAKFCDNCGQGI